MPLRSVLWAAVFWITLAGVTYLALTPEPPRAIFRISDVILHAVAFATLTFLLAIAHFGKRLAWPIALMICYGPLLELLQSGVVGRSGEWKDFGVDLLGIGLGSLMIHYGADAADRLLQTVLKHLGWET